MCEPPTAAPGADRSNYPASTVWLIKGRLPRLAVLAPSHEPGTQDQVMIGKGQRRHAARPERALEEAARLQNGLGFFPVGNRA